MPMKRNFSPFLKGLICITLLLLVPTGYGGELIETEAEAFFSFVRALDPENVLRISRSGRIPHPCSLPRKGNSIKCDLQTIVEIKLEDSNLTGTINADSLCKLSNLRVLNLARNYIHGSIPRSILQCASLTCLNLSSNLLSGMPPVGLTKLKHLKTFDISSNQLLYLNPISREVAVRRRHNPRRIMMVTSSMTLDSVVHDSNNKTDGTPNSSKQKWFDNYRYVVPLGFLVIFFTVFVYFMMKRVLESFKKDEDLESPPASPQKTPPPPSPPREEPKTEEINSDLVFFAEEHERFSLNDLLDTTAELQCQTSSSSLYKVTLKNRTVYAIKRIKRSQVSVEEFNQTMRVIGHMKHPNILALVGYNSSRDEKLLIYKYQRNGSLLNRLHDHIAGKSQFPWQLRLSIAIGIAKGLDYIYQNSDGRKAIPHGNIKLSNILIDDTEEPLISDYGITRFRDPKKSCILVSNGYTAPEKTESEQGDVYSYGIILLELLTGKTVEGSGIDLPKWVRSMIREEWTGEVFDKEVSVSGRQYGFSLLNISLKCVSQKPEDRPTVAEVLDRIEEVISETNNATASTVESPAPQEWDVLRSVIPETWDTPGSNH